MVTQKTISSFSKVIACDNQHFLQLFGYQQEFLQVTSWLLTPHLPEDMMAALLESLDLMLILTTSNKWLLNASCTFVATDRVNISHNQIGLWILLHLLISPCLLLGICLFTTCIHKHVHLLITVYSTRHMPRYSRGMELTLRMVYSLCRHYSHRNMAGNHQARLQLFFECSCIRK